MRYTATFIEHNKGINMSVSILIISHDNIGNSFVNAVKTTYGQLPLFVHTLNVMHDDNPDILITQLNELIQKLNRGDGILILTDLFGATPSNIAREILNENIRIVCGLNLPMLMRVMNYHKLPLHKLAENALKGGQAGIVTCESKQEQLNATQKTHHC